MKVPSEFPIINTGRLRLRPMTAEDAGLVVHWRNQPHVSGMSERKRSSLLTVEEHIDWFSITRDDRIDYVIEIIESNQPIGSMSYVLNKQTDKVVMGKYIGEVSALGFGYATEACRAWMDFAFRYLGAHSIEAITHISNSANIRLNTNLGFKVKGTNADWLTMEALKDDSDRR